MKINEIFLFKALLSGICKFSARFVFALALMMCYFIPVNDVLAQNRALEIRTGRREEQTYRLVIETASEPSWKYFILTGPNRLVVDVANTGISGIENKTQKIGSVSAVRMGVFSGTTARFVLETKNPVRVVKTLTLPPSAGMQWRIVVDFSTNDDDASTSSATPQAPVKTDGKNTTANAITAANTNASTNTTLNTAANQPATTVRQPVILAPVKRTKFTIVLDAGHGGRDPGAIGVSGIHEKQIVLTTAKLLREELNKDPRYKVVMTRDTDVYIPLWERARIAEDNRADLFISIHADSHPKASTTGLSVYTLSDVATDEESRKLAEKENASDLMGIGKEFANYSKDVKSILSDVVQRDVKMSSVEFGDIVVKEAKKSARIKCLPNSPLREAPFWVLRSSVPSALVELGYLSNKQEETLLRTTDYRQELAKSLKASIDKMFE